MKFLCSQRTGLQFCQLFRLLPWSFMFQVPTWYSRLDHFRSLGCVDFVWVVRRCCVLSVVFYMGAKLILQLPWIRSDTVYMIVACILMAWLCSCIALYGSNIVTYGSRRILKLSLGLAGFSYSAVGFRPQSAPSRALWVLYSTFVSIFKNPERVQNPRRYCIELMRTKEKCAILIRRTTQRHAAPLYDTVCVFISVGRRDIVKLDSIFQ